MEENNKNQKNDTFVDFTWGCALNFFILAVGAMIMSILAQSQPKISFDVSPVIGILMLLIEIYFLYKYFKTRIYTAIGMISLFIIPMLIWGACSLMLKH